MRKQGLPSAELLMMTERIPNLADRMFPAEAKFSVRAPKGRGSLLMGAWTVELRVSNDNPSI